MQIQVIQGQVRTLRDALEVRYQQRMMGDSTLIPWMIQHAVGILNRYRMGGDRDGRTPHHRVKGRKFNQAVVEFGECVWYLKPESEGKVQGGCPMGRRDLVGH